MGTPWWPGNPQRIGHENSLKINLGHPQRFNPVNLLFAPNYARPKAFVLQSQRNGKWIDNPGAKITNFVQPYHEKFGRDLTITGYSDVNEKSTHLMVIPFEDMASQNYAFALPILLVDPIFENSKCSMIKKPIPNTERILSILKPVQILQSNQYLRSINREGFAILQRDGNFIIDKTPGPHDNRDFAWNSGKTRPLGIFWISLQNGKYVYTGAYLAMLKKLFGQISMLETWVSTL